jgi:hypothetical protein
VTLTLSFDAPFAAQKKHVKHVSLTITGTIRRINFPIKLVMLQNVFSVTIMKVITLLLEPF